MLPVTRTGTITVTVTVGAVQIMSEDIAAE
jgi:hypothetical protein